MWELIGGILGIVVGALVGYGFVFWIAWRIVSNFGGEKITDPTVLGAIAIAASILCLAVVQAIASESRK
jgi:hypothetical protein